MRKNDDHFREGVIAFSEFTCESNSDCVVVAKFPEKYEGNDLSLLVSLETYQSKEKSLETVVAGKKGDLDKLELHINYEAKNGYSIWSVIELKHNKIKNYHSLCSLGRARPF